MRKGLILGFVGNNPKHARRLPDDAVGQLIRGNVPLGYRTVLTGIEGNFEMGCAAAALRLRGEGLKIKLHIAVTRGKYKTYLRYKRDNLRPSEAHRIIEQADNVEIIEGKTPLEAERLRDRHVVDKSDLLFYYSTQLRDDFRNKILLSGTAAPAEKCLRLVGQERPGVRGKGSQLTLYAGTGFGCHGE